MEDLQESIEDLTEIVRTNYQYNSSLGFPVLQFKSDEQFVTSFTKNIQEVKPFIVQEIVLNQSNRSYEQDQSSANRQELKSQNSFSQEIQVVSTEEIQQPTSPE